MAAGVVRAGLRLGTGRRWHRLWPRHDDLRHKRRVVRGLAERPADARLQALGPQGSLVNVARGSVVDEAALAAALVAGGIAGAALDIFEREPHVPQALIESERTVLTPHVASATVAARTAMADLVLANVDALLAGTPFPSAVA